MATPPEADPIFKRLRELWLTTEPYCYVLMPDGGSYFYGAHPPNYKKPVIIFTQFKEELSAIMTDLKQCAPRVGCIHGCTVLRISA